MHSHTHHHLHLPHQLNKLKNGLYTLYIAHSIKGFVGSLVGFFIPIYLYTIGFSIVEILIFFCIRSFFIILFSLLTGGIGNKFGLKHTMTISLPLFLLYLIGTMLLKENISHMLLYTLAIVSALASSLYWVPMHCLFTRLSSKKKGTSQLGMLISLRSISTILAPLLGGFITLKFGFESLFVMSILILIIPIILLLNSKDIHPHIIFSFKDFLTFFKKNHKHFYMIILDSFGAFMETVLWPLFVFLMLASTVSVGLVGSLVGVGTILFTVVLSATIAKRKHLMIIKIASFMLAGILTIKFFTNTEASIYATSLLAGLFATMFSIPLISHTYEIARKSKNLDEFIILKEMLSQSGVLIATIVAILIATKINVSFLMAGIGYLLITIL